MIDNETWILEVGDDIIEKKTKSSYESLTLLEQSIYCLWVIDYAVRNAGSLDPIEDLHPSAIDELIANAKAQGWKKIAHLIHCSEEEEEDDFCDRYCQDFDESCNELRLVYDNR
ncbi:hypothetical protein [Agarilytica rhodophyticola]|uniref:hypothetical protein n=1 Tax=Agarilytica rhodophyticola TaxID=1737490 RepID=UPI000B348B0D|nr:hypothetical protein [Agarilytica rhodophyticola]